MAWAFVHNLVGKVCLVPQIPEGRINKAPCYFYVRNFKKI